MHPNPAFRRTGTADALDFARQRSFGTLCVNHDAGPLLAHIPFLIAPDGQSVELHLVRTNPILACLPSKAVISVTGPDAYISPDWYGVPDQVPTWNYIAVHLRGELRCLDHGDMQAMLDRQSAALEAHLLPKPPWKTAKMDPQIRERMMRAIIPCRMEISEVQSTWKLGQNKPDTVRHAAADGVDAAGIGSDTASLAAMMRRLDDSRP